MSLMSMFRHRAVALARAAALVLAAFGGFARAADVLAPSASPPPGSARVVLPGGLTLHVPGGWQSSLVDATRVGMASPDGMAVIIGRLDALGGRDPRAELEQVIDLGSGVILSPVGGVREEGGALTHDYQVTGTLVPARAWILGRVLSDGRALVLVGFAPIAAFADLQATMRALHASASVTAAARAGAGSWAAELGGRYLVRFYSGNGYHEKHELWLCSNGNYAYAMDGGGFTAGVASGAFGDVSEGAWSASGAAGAPGQLDLTGVDGRRMSLRVEAGADGIYLDGTRWMRGDNTRCP
jgi:hypothetical protein